jgi:hypothetical protein
MSKVHVLTGMSGRYSAVLHVPVPVGSNAIGVTWKECLLSGGTKVSILPIGIGKGQITQAEMDQITSGDVIEYQWEIPTNADGSAPSISFIDALAEQEKARHFVETAVQYKYFGYVQE